MQVVGHRGSHTVFRHTYDSASHSQCATFAVRRVQAETRHETQIEAKLESIPNHHGKTRRRSAQHMSLCMPPAEAVRLAAAIAPELLHELRMLNVDEHGEQKRNTPAARIIAMAEGAQ